MWIFRIVVVVALALISIEAKPMELEDFLSSLASKPEEDTQDDDVKESAQSTDEELFQFARRSGLLAEPQQASSDTNGAVNNQNIVAALQALQALKRQQTLQVYSPDYVQPVGTATGSLRSTRAVQPGYDANSQIVYNDYQKASSQDSTNGVSGQQNRLTAQQGYNQQQPNSQLSYSPQYAESTIRSSQQAPQTANDIQSYGGIGQTYSTSQRAASNDGKAAMKDDRQGHYAYDGYGYEPAVVNNHLAHARSPVAENYAHHQPEPYSKLNLPIPSVSIKFDPLGLLKLLLQGIPRPLFNLNGRVFLGLELGKGIGLGKGAAPHAAGHGGHYGGGRVITIG